MILPNSLLPTKNKGFTLIELLIVIAIIGIILSLGLAGFQRAQVNARDARRVQDMDQVKIALELHFDTNLTYPQSDTGQIKCVGGLTIGWGNEFICDSQTFMKELPNSPGTIDYCYVTPFVVTPDEFQLYAQMENDIHRNYGLGTPAGCPPGNYDYLVENAK